MERKVEAERKSRPAKGASRKEEPRKEYGPIGQFRNILNVGGKDVEYFYRWFQDKSESGQRIFDAVAAGWEMVDATKETEITIGKDSVTQTDKFGSLFRRHADKEGNYLYLMRMPMEGWEIVQAAKAAAVDAKEADLFREYDPDLDDGIYGQNRMKSELRRRPSRDD